MSQFKVGDIVMLKSGGPSMTVEEIQADGRVACSWFDGKSLKSAVFVPGMLVIDTGPGIA